MCDHISAATSDTSLKRITMVNVGTMVCLIYLCLFKQNILSLLKSTNVPTL